MGMRKGTEVMHNAYKQEADKLEITLKEVELRGSNEALKEEDEIPDKMSGMPLLGRTIIKKPVYTDSDQFNKKEMQFQAEGVKWTRYNRTKPAPWRELGDDDVYYFDGEIKE